MAETRTALITGAAQGVGLATAQRLVRDGVGRLVLVDRNAERLEETAASLRRDGVEAEALALDLADVDAVIEKANALCQRLGRVDILVNAAGCTDRGTIDTTTPEVFDRLYAVNARAPFFLMQAVRPVMPRGGVIVSVTSMLAHGGPPFLLAYSASKAALVTLTKGLANALKGDGIRAFAINLGWTVTPGERIVQTQVHGHAEDWAETFGARQPFGRLLMPEDPAGLIAFLVSPDAQMMTGAIIDLDQYVVGTMEDNPGL